MILWDNQNLPPSLADWLRTKGHEARHVQELGLHNVDDIDIAARALTEDATIISKDSDFAFKGPPPTVVARLGNVTNARLITRFEGAWPSILSALQAGETYVEIL